MVTAAAGAAAGLCYVNFLPGGQRMKSGKIWRNIKLKLSALPPSSLRAERFREAKGRDEEGSGFFLKEFSGIYHKGG